VKFNRYKSIKTFIDDKEEEAWKNWVVEPLLRMEKDVEEMQDSIQHIKGQMKPTWMRIRQMNIHLAQSKTFERSIFAIKDIFLRVFTECRTS
jgi:hypothetical protein